MSGCGASADSGSSTDANAPSTTDATSTTEHAAASDALLCENPLSATRVDGQTLDLGFEACGGGWYHRNRAVECASALPRAQAVVGYQGDTCEDTSCTSSPNDFCIAIGGVGPTSTFCMNGCVRDDECDAGQICFCDDPVGRCVPASCTTDADCPGSLCVGTTNPAPCGGPELVAFACAGSRDECLSTADCGDRGGCQVGGQQLIDGEWQPAPRKCGYGASCGRPFLVGGTPRQAGVTTRTDWASAAHAPDLRGLDSNARGALAAHWTELGLMEHASVAAFARFVLELMAAGAPSELVSSAQRALGDEIEHARLCFGLASTYASKPLGPGELCTRGVLDDLGVHATVVRAIHEACVGETLAAIEALEALTSASDPAVIDVLERVVRDETAHAELGWRFLKWALAGADRERRELAHSELQRAVDLALAASLPDVGSRRPAACPELERHGLCSAARRNEARREALLHIVLPLARELWTDSSEPRCRDGAEDAADPRGVS
jgi:hypothetical protein